MRIFITGIAGFIGSHLAEHFMRAGHTVTGVDDLSTGRDANLPLVVGWPVEFADELYVHGDIADPAVFHGTPDVIYHCAASYKDRSDWERDARTNVAGTINVVRFAQRTGAKLIYFQTSLCYGPRLGLITPDAPLAPVGSYAVSKSAGEAYIRDSGVPYVSLRLANIYGPRNLSGPVPAFYRRLSAGESCTVVDARRDYVYIDDLVRVAVIAATEGSGVYHVSSGSDYPIAEVYAAVRSALDLPPDEPTLAPRGPDDVATLLLDPAITEATFGWRAETSLWPGIRRAVEWYGRHGVSETYTHLAMGAKA